MIADLMDILFGCWHSNYSFPLTAKPGNRATAAQATGTYVVCLDCGKEFPYDWKTMKVVSGKPVLDNTLEFPEMAPASQLARKHAA
jgi:hypothetical protein